MKNANNNGGNNNNKQQPAGSGPRNWKGKRFNPYKYYANRVFKRKNNNNNDAGKPGFQPIPPAGDMTTRYNPVKEVVSTPNGQYTNARGNPNNTTKRTTHTNVQMESGSAEQNANTLNAIRSSDFPPLPESTYANWSGNLCFKLAYGYWCALRRANFTVGYPGQNDKYVAPFYANFDPSPKYPVDRMFINKFAQIFCHVHDCIRDGAKPDVQVPKHIMFALQMVAKKVAVQTNVSVIDLGSYAYIVPWGATGPDVSRPVRITTAMMEDDSDNGLSKFIDLYNWIANHPKRPFDMTDSFQAESNVTIYTDKKGDLIHSTMKYDEVSSIYGYSTTATTNPGLVYYNNYDYSGMTQPSSTAHFRAMFFLVQGVAYANTINVDGLAPATLLKYQYVANDSILINYCMSGHIVTSERVFPASAYDSIQGDVAKSKFLEYVQTAMNIKLAGLAQFNPNPSAFNCAIALAAQLQTKNGNFGYDISSLYNTGEEYLTDVDNSIKMNVAIAQFPERIPLPSPLFEEFKSISDIKSWTYEGVSEPVGCYYTTPPAWPIARGLAPITSDDPGANINLFFSAVQQVYNDLLPYRSFMRLNHAPEYGNYMPNMHIFYTDSKKVYTPLDTKTFDDKEIIIFMNYTLMPLIPRGIALPLNFVSVKRVDYDRVVFNLASLSVDVSTNSNTSSEIDEYHRLLRVKHIGFWGALAGILGANLPKIIDFATHIFKPTEKTKEKINKTVDNVANGSDLINSVISGVINHIDSKQIGITGGRKSGLRKVLGLASNGLGMVANLRDTKMV